MSACPGFSNAHSPFVVIPTQIYKSTRLHITFTLPDGLSMCEVREKDQRWLRNAIARHNDTAERWKRLRIGDLCPMSGNALTMSCNYIAPANFQRDTSLAPPPEGMAYQWISNILAQYSERQGKPAYKPEEIAWYTARPEDLEALSAIFDRKRKDLKDHDIGSKRAPEKVQEKAPHQAGSSSLSKCTDKLVASHPKPQAAANASSAELEESGDDNPVVGPSTPQPTSRQALRKQKREQAKNNRRQNKKAGNAS